MGILPLIRCRIACEASASVSAKGRVSVNRRVARVSIEVEVPKELQSDTLLAIEPRFDNDKSRELGLDGTPKS